MILKHNADAAQYLVTFMDDVILSITGAVYKAVEKSVEQIFGEVEGFKDMFTLCTVAIDNGIINTVSGLLALTMTITPSKLSLGADGTVLVEAQTFASSKSVEDKSVLGPTPALTWLGMIGKTAGLAGPVSAVVTDVTTLVDNIQADNKTTPPEEL
jgi:hypothetical protein